MKIVLKQLTKIFEGRGKSKGQKVVAVNSFDLTVPDGALVGLLGPSGCGKSTLLNLICGLETPTEGRIFFGDDDITDLPPEARGVGMVFQNYALYPHLTVRENISFPLENLRGSLKLSKEIIAEKVARVAALVQISELMDRRPDELSGGQQQRVAIARALVKTPRVLLLDEPLSNLDARLRLQTREEIRRIQRETGVTTLFVTHDQEEAMSICDVMIVMKDGVLQQMGAPQEIYEDPVNLFVAKFLGTPQINVFEGEVRSGRLYIGNADVLAAEGAPDGKMWVGVRPEGFVPDEAGALECDMVRVEVMGRDTSIISRHPAFCGDTLRTMIPTARGMKEKTGKIRFSLVPEKTHLFSAFDEKRVYCAGGCEE